MINRVVILPRRNVEHLLEHGEWKHKEGPTENWGLISIYGGKTELVTFQARERLKELGCIDTLSLMFDDIAPDSNPVNVKIAYGGREVKLFDSTVARHIVNFIDEVKDKIDTLVVHCAAGVSRSGAVGIFVCRYLGLNEEDFRKENPRIMPNFFVLSVLNEESGLNQEYVSRWEAKVNPEIRERLDRLFR